MTARALLGLLLLAACDPSGSEGGSPDAAADAGDRAPDTGVSATSDAGDRPSDAGDTSTDAATSRADAGTPGGDAGTAPADVGDAAVDAGESGASEPGPAAYPAGELHSPLTPRLVDALRAVRAAHPELDGDAFMKLGDSLTSATSFLHCFGGASVDLDGRPLEATLAHFAGSFDRESLAAAVGWNASAPLDGDPSPLDDELAATSAAFALVMFGTNDLALMDPARFANDLLALVDALLDAGVIPIVSSIPPRGDDMDADEEVPRYNLAARGVAQARQVPFVDLELVMRPLAGFGLGGDDLHPSGDARGACVLDAGGLEHGANVRNLATLEALDRVRRAVVDEQDAPDPDAPARAGRGIRSEPFVIDALPYTALDDTRAASSDVDVWTGCGTADASGPELYYRLELEAPAQLRLRVADGTEVDVDVHALSADGEPADCVARHDRDLVVDLPAGDSLLVLDTAGGSSQAGPFLLTIAAE